MKINLKVSRPMIEQIREDLLRPHPFAFERVGFLFVKPGTAERDSLLLLSSNYMPVPDDQYINDPDVGAKINSAAIRTAMQTVMDTGAGAIHIHTHPHSGNPEFSKVDKLNNKRLIPSFRNANPNLPHGAIVMSDNMINGLIWLPKGESIRISKISVIGHHCEFIEPTTRVSKYV